MDRRWPNLSRQPSYAAAVIQEKYLPQRCGELWDLASECDWKMLELDTQAYQLYLSLLMGAHRLKELFPGLGLELDL